jgi:ribosome-associated protein
LKRVYTEPMNTLDKALSAIKIIREKKAIDPVLIEVSELTSIADYFLIAGGNSSRQVQAIGRHLSRKMRDMGFKAYGMEGEKEGHWILMDYSDIVIHIFYQPVREFYNLEGLWIEAPRRLLDEENKKKG